MSSRLLLAALACFLLLGADFPELRARKRGGLKVNHRSAALIAPTAWGAEPERPAVVDPAKLAHALKKVCGFMPPGRAERYAGLLLESSARHGEDPFLLAALGYRMSRCDPDSRAEGLGLTGIAPDMYRDNVRGRSLRYPVPESGLVAERRKELSVGFMEKTLLTAEGNLEWAAALLAMWREQHALVDGHFPQAPHRHYVSHFVWGDRVQSARAEDRVFLDRRRLLAHYGVSLPQPTRKALGVVWGAPLEGGPRVVSSKPGADRDGGLRAHRGVDIEATFGEPVFALADGVVSFAGVDLPGLAHSRSLSPEAIGRVSRRRLGHGGRYVCITHLEAHGDAAWLRSCSMHLETVLVRTGQRVSRGELLGTVGRTGMKSSAPHLHLEIKTDKALYDARDVLGSMLLGDPPADTRRRRQKSRRLYPPLATVPVQVEMQGSN
jgi:murein DD-endopeptidase MepM/ murein hydrolase activator NlpD